MGLTQLLEQFSSILKWVKWVTITDICQQFVNVYEQYNFLEILKSVHVFKRLNMT